MCETFPYIQRSVQTALSLNHDGFQFLPNVQHCNVTFEMKLHTINRTRKQLTVVYSKLLLRVSDGKSFIKIYTVRYLL